MGQQLDNFLCNLESLDLLKFTLLIDIQGKIRSVLRWRKKTVMERCDGSEVTTIELPAHHHNMTGELGQEVTNKAGIGVMKEGNEPEKAETGEELIDIPVVHISTSSSLSTNTCQAPSGRLFKYFNQSSRNTFVSCKVGSKSLLLCRE